LYSKICNKCGKEFPATTEYFSKKNGGKFGVMAVCKKCDVIRTSKYYKDTIQPSKIAKRLNRTCPVCGKTFNTGLGKGYGQKYCSNYCKNKNQRLGHVSERLLYSKEWRKRNKLKYNMSRLKRQHERAHEDFYFKFNRYISAVIRRALNYKKNSVRVADCLGYPIERLKEHIENKFQPGMSWGNHGKWHIDHIIPISLWEYKKSTDREFKQCWALCNLQPLWAEDNLKKGNQCQ